MPAESKPLPPLAEAACSGLILQPRLHEADGRQKRGEGKGEREEIDFKRAATVELFTHLPHGVKRAFSHSSDPQHPGESHPFVP